MSLGIVKGNENYNLNPNDNITRQDMFVMTARAMTITNMLPRISTRQWVAFEDWAQMAPYASANIQRLARLKLVNGFEHRLEPTKFALRSEAAEFLTNILT